MLAASLELSKVKKTVVEFENQGAEMCNSLTLSHVLSKTGTVPTQPAMIGK